MELDILRPNWLISLDHKLLPQAGTVFLGIVTNLDRNVRNASHAAYLHLGSKQADAIFCVRRSDKFEFMIDTKGSESAQD
jgi:hypothetical protein